MLTTVWVAVSTKRWLRACAVSASRLWVTRANRQPASAATTSNPAATETQPTSLRWAGRRGGGRTAVSGLVDFAFRFGSAFGSALEPAPASTLTVGSPPDSVA